MNKQLKGLSSDSAFISLCAADCELCGKKGLSLAQHSAAD